MTIETLKRELAYAKSEADKVARAKLELEKKLNEVKRYADGIMEKDKETKNKMAEAIELIESAVREKDLVLRREALALEEKTRVEYRLAVIATEYDAKIQELNKKTHDEIESNAKRYLTEIKELKTELREKAALVEKTQRDLKFTDEELTKIRNDLSAKTLDYEEKTKRLELRLQTYDEAIAKNRYDMEINRLKDKITTLEGGLVTSNDKLQKLEQHGMEDRTKKSDRETKDIMIRYTDLEAQLSKTLGVKENLVLQLKSLKHDFDYEIQKRDNERHSLEKKIHELEVDLRKTNRTNENKSQDALVVETNPYSFDVEHKRTLDIT